MPKANSKASNNTSPQKKKNLSEIGKITTKFSNKTSIAIIVSEWNKEITDALCEGAYNTLLSHGIKKNNIHIHYVPGSFELPLGAQYAIENTTVDAVICLGCVIQGETRHFEFICQSVSRSIAQLNIEYNIPVIFGVLTTDTYQQAKDRSGGKHGNKGVEAAFAALKMIELRNKFLKS